MPQGPMDPRTSGRSYAKRGVEPVRHTGPKGPQARGATEKRHHDTYPTGAANIKAGPFDPSAKQK